MKTQTPLGSWGRAALAAAIVGLAGCARDAGDAARTKASAAQGTAAAQALVRDLGAPHNVLVLLPAGRAPWSEAFAKSLAAELTRGGAKVVTKPLASPGAEIMPEAAAASGDFEKALQGASADLVVSLAGLPEPATRLAGLLPAGTRLAVVLQEGGPDAVRAAVDAGTVAWAAVPAADAAPDAGFETGYTVLKRTGAGAP
jgi:hypothetical protein